VDHITRWAGTWEDWDLELEEVMDAGGDQVIAFTYERGRTKTGIELDEHHSELYRLRDGKIVYRKGFSDADEALEAAWLGE
jgi:ketosteroid isomerase-like protein